MELAAFRATAPRAVPIAILAASAGALGFAYVAETVFGIEPCVLCLYQRVPYAATGIVAVLMLGLPTNAPVTRWGLTVCAALYLTGAGIASYHVGVERHWWVSVAACGGGDASAVTIESLNAQLSAPSEKPCDQVDWTLFGLSMAGYNVALSALLGAAALWAWRLLGGRPAP
ncbi:MAG TPA: disulfide bond formation protein B [Rhodospirillales bacterium]|jgi:disulfide bond formation protein DsbB|nr:disulfide bond formation protein B [Rhodospirillales bacterium]HJO69528.1 disulfide bond formation protein B [Rhodospirillales bacterium]